MRIQENGRDYTITETKAKWTVETNIGAITVQYSITKELCPTVDDVIQLLRDNNLFLR